MKLDQLPTPAVVVDLEILERNLSRMAEAAKAAGLALRPHAKTHKTLEIARRQRAAGASGLTVAKTGEAELYAEAGFDDLFLAYPVVGVGKPERLLAVSEKARVIVGIDSVEGARALGAAFHRAGRTVEVRIEIDSGMARTGVLPEQADQLAVAVAGLPGLRLEGVFTHGGHSYGSTTPEARARAAAEEAETLLEATARIRRRGLEVRSVSLGSTPTARAAMTVPGITECRPGNYVFHDASQVALGTCGLEDCALTVLATVVSVPASDRAVLDAGSKALSSDPLRPRAEGFGQLLGTSSRVARLSEEHGIVEVRSGDAFQVGQRVRVLPNHSCVVANLSLSLAVARGEELVEHWPVLARGRVE